MGKLESIIRKAFFYGAFVIGMVAAIEKAANIFRTSLIKPYTPQELLEWCVIALIFAIAMQLHEIRLLLSSNRNNPAK
jgi:uncharacterized membrane protein